MLKKFFVGMFGPKTMTIQIHLIGGSVITLDNVIEVKTSTSNTTNRFVSYSIVRKEGCKTFFDICMSDISAVVQVPNK
jgi:hypothetical protein